MGWRLMPGSILLTVLACATREHCPPELVVLLRELRWGTPSEQAAAARDLQFCEEYRADVESALLEAWRRAPSEEVSTAAKEALVHVGGVRALRVLRAELEDHDLMIIWRRVGPTAWDALPERLRRTTGRVVANGQPVCHAELMLVHARNPALDASDARQATWGTRTDAAGRFVISLPRTPCGMLSLWMRWGNRWRFLAGTEYPSGWGRDRYGPADFEVAPLNSVFRVRAIDSDGKPVVGAYALFAGYSLEGAPFDETRYPSDGNGIIEVGPVEDEMFALDLYAPGKAPRRILPYHYCLDEPGRADEIALLDESTLDVRLDVGSAHPDETLVHFVELREEEKCPGLFVAVRGRVARLRVAAGVEYRVTALAAGHDPASAVVRGSHSDCVTLTLTPLRTPGTGWSDLVSRYLDW